MFPSFRHLPADHFSRSNRTLVHLTLILILSAFILAALGAGSVKATQASAVTPTMNGISLFGTSDLIHVRGTGFTPGGRVQIVVVDHWGNALREPVWTMAAAGGPFGADGLKIGVTGFDDPGSIALVLRLEGLALYGPNGSQDPANGYRAGVDIGDLADAGSIQVRAFDEYASTWSNFAVVDTDSALALGQDPQLHDEVPPTCIAARLCELPY